MSNFLNYHFQEMISDSPDFMIFRGTDREKNQKVILKFFKEEPPSASLFVQKRYGMELASRLANFIPDNIEANLGIVSDGEKIALVLEDSGGIPLDQILAKFPQDLTSCLELFIKLVKTIARIHKQGIFLKNIHPSHLLWHPEKKLFKVIGFDHACSLPSEDFELNGSDVEGALTYLSPEQTLRMNTHVDYRADYYALGVILYEMLTREPPLSGSHKMEFIYALMSKQPRPPHEIDHTIPPTLSAIVLKLLQKCPEQRYQSLSGLLLDLENIQGQWEQHHRIEHFEVGLKDLPAHLCLSQRIYERDHQIKALADSFNRASQGRTKLTFVTGQPGIGKSILIREILKPITAQKGYFINGKCDKYKKNIPYDPLINAFTTLILQIKKEPLDDQARWKAVIKEAVGINGQILVDAIPQLQDILDVQEPVPYLEPAENKNRFRYVFQRLIQAFASDEHPLTLFLQDLQWADAQTLEVLCELVTDYNTRFFFIIGSYHDTEVDPSHILSITIEEIKRGNVAFHSLQLNPFDLLQIQSFLQDTFQVDQGKLQDLAEYCLRKTSGNPFYLNELLHSLIEEQLITFDKSAGYCWDIAQIEKNDHLGTLLDLITQRILSLPKPTQDLLHLASCLGDHFELHVLAELSGKTPQQVSAELWMAMEKNLILPCSPSYKYVEYLSNSPITYRFKHDKIRQASYSLISNVKKKVVHYKAGKLLLNMTSPEEIEDRIFDITNQMNLGLDLLENDIEKIQLAYLNFKAAKKAKSLSGFKVAVSFLKTAYDLLPPQSWENSYNLTFDILKSYSTCLYIDRQHEHAELIAAQAVQHARTALEKVEIISRQVNLYCSLGKYEEAINIGTKGLGLLKITIPKNPSFMSFAKETLLNKWHMGRRSIADLSNLHEIKDPASILAIKLLQECGTAAYFLKKPTLNYFLILKQVNILLRDGLHEKAIQAFLSYAISVHHLGQFEAAKDYSELVIKLLDKYPFTPTKGRILAVYALMLHAWYHPFKSLDSFFQKAVQAGLDNGDALAILLGGSYVHFWNPEMPLQEVIQDGRKYLTLIKQSHNENGWYSAKIIYQLKANLCGLTRDQFSLSDEEFEEETALKKMSKSHFYSGIAAYYHCKSIVAYHFGNASLAWEYLQKSAPHIDTIEGSLLSAEHNFYTCLILAKLSPEMDSYTQNHFMKRIQDGLQKQLRWSALCPANFLSQYLTISAEIKVIYKEFDQALELYEEALQKAQKQQLLEFSGLACERAAALLAKTGNLEKSSRYRKQAIEFYQRWGASAKVQMLTQNDRDL